MKALKQVLSTAIALAVAAVVVYAIYSHRASIAPIIQPIVAGFETTVGINKPCSQPIAYSIGEFDTQFRISQADFLKDAAAAAAIWDKAAGKQLFAYAADGSLKLNLIYDNRQKTTTELQTIGSTIKGDQASYDSLKASYNGMVSSYDSAKAALNGQIASFNASKAAYEQQVSDWNARGGAPRDQYNALEQQRVAVNNQADAINQAESSLNTMADKINSTAADLNSLASKLNLNVKSYNTVGASTGVEFDEGEYVSDESGQRIDVYEYSTNDQLVRVLTHELGHALGMNHVADARSIMYPLNQSANEVPTASDIAELDRVCDLPAAK